MPTDHTPRRHQLIRDQSGSDMLELGLVYAVVTVLLIRLFLSLTGYPQLGGGNLHIAHMLWGGLGMLLAIGLLITYWNPVIRQAATILGGIGFGFFIDELGKFITSDNNYFFQPTIALIYVIFIALFLGVRAAGNRPLSTHELSVNRAITTAINAGEHPAGLGRIYEMVVGFLAATYRRLIATRWFAPAISLTFVVFTIGQLVAVFSLITGRGPEADRSVPIFEQGASALSALFVLIGVLQLRRSRLSAYQWFQRGTLVTICVTQVFMFYYSELAALGGLVVHLLLYFALRFLVTRERALDHSESRT